MNKYNYADALDAAHDQMTRLQNEYRASATQVGGTHYKDKAVQPWDVVDTWPLEQRIGAYRHGALKYVMRMGTKDENVQEIKKAVHYLQKLIEVLEVEASKGTK